MEEMGEDGDQLGGLLVVGWGECLLGEQLAGPGQDEQLCVCLFICRHRGGSVRGCCCLVVVVVVVVVVVAGCSPVWRGGRVEEWRRGGRAGGACATGESRAAMDFCAMSGPSSSCASLFVCLFAFRFTG